MNNIDLHDKFIEALLGRVQKRAELVTRISEILHIEKESASRRLNGAVSLSVREMGILSRAFNISLDMLLSEDREDLWLPVVLQSPLMRKSVDAICDDIANHLEYVRNITQETAESGRIHSSIPLEFFMSYPALRKFLFFKWGYYFNGTEEFENFSAWKFPQRLESITDISEVAYLFERIFYIWDNSIISTLAIEIDNFHRMSVITTKEKKEIKDDLRHLLLSLEDFLTGKSIPNYMIASQVDFYIAYRNLGFTNIYHVSEKMCLNLYMNDFSYVYLTGLSESFNKMKSWADSLKNVSALISGSGLMNRRVFFKRQHDILDYF